MQDMQQRRRRIIEALHHGVVPATGCTEPVSLALAAARAARLVGGRVEQVEVRASANLVKNAMAVTVPGTTLAGPAIAAALGAVCGDPDGGLAVLARVAPPDVARWCSPCRGSGPAAAAGWSSTGWRTRSRAWDGWRGREWWPPTARSCRS